jgi:hypothetical protein
VTLINAVRAQMSRPSAQEADRAKAADFRISLFLMLNVLFMLWLIRRCEHHQQRDLIYTCGCVSS